MYKITYSQLKLFEEIAINTVEKMNCLKNLYFKLYATDYVLDSHSALHSLLLKTSRIPLITK